MAKKTCSPLKPNTSFLLNAFIHILILFSFLTIFFILIVSKLESETLQEQIKNMIDTNLKEAIANSDKQTGGKLKKLLQKISNNKSFDIPGSDTKGSLFDILEYKYSSPDQLTQDWNKWVYRMAWLGVGSLLVLVLTMWITLTISCKKCINGPHIFWENLLIFICIGIVEYVFFINIAMKFVPIPPSYLVAQFFKNLKENI